MELRSGRIIPGPQPQSMGTKLRSGRILVLPEIQPATESNISRENSEPASEPATDAIEVDENNSGSDNSLNNPNIPIIRVRAVSVPCEDGVPGYEETSNAAITNESHDQGDSEWLCTLAIQAYAVLQLQTRHGELVSGQVATVRAVQMRETSIKAGLTPESASR